MPFYPRSPYGVSKVFAHYTSLHKITTNRTEATEKRGRGLVEESGRIQGMHAVYDQLLTDVRAACEAHYGSRLVALAVFGSVGRGTPQPDSDVDLLLIAEGLPNGRLPRMAQFQAIETAVEPRLADAWREGLHPSLSPVFKTPAEVLAGSPLFLDMTEDARILYDRDGFLQRAFADLESRLERLGARRIWRGNAWYWDLKPDYTPGEVFEI